MERMKSIQTVTVAVDVDGVLAEQVIPVLKRIKEKYGISLSKEQITEWEFQIGNTDIKTEIELAEKEEDFVRSMLPLKGCSEALSKLAHTFQVVVATSRDPMTDSWTKDWLNANGIKYHRFVNTHEEGKSLPSVQILIDDYEQNIKEFVTSGSDSRQAILFSQPWNTDHHSLMPFIVAKRVYVASGWSKVVDLIRRIRRSSLGELSSSLDT